MLSIFKKGEEKVLWELFCGTVHKINQKDYTAKQLQAWAPFDYDEEVWQKSFEDKICFVALEEKKIIGFIDMTFEGHIDRLFTHKDFQQKGVASLLLQKIEEAAKKLKLEELHVESSITALPFFLAKKFIVVKEQIKTIRGENLQNYLMRKALLKNPFG